MQSSLQQQHVFLTSLFSKGVKGTEFSLLFALFIDHLPRPGEGNKSPAQRTLEYSRQLRELRQGWWRGCFYRTTCGHNMTDIMFSNNPIYNNISSAIATYNWLSIKVWRASKYRAYLWLGCPMDTYLSTATTTVVQMLPFSAICKPRYEKGIMASGCFNWNGLNFIMRLNWNWQLWKQFFPLWYQWMLGWDKRQIN